MVSLICGITHTEKVKLIETERRKYLPMAGEGGGKKIEGG